MPEKIVSNPTQDKTLKPKQKEKPVIADEPLHAEEAKINKYGFFHVDKKLAEHLDVAFGKDKQDVLVTIERIPGGFIIRLEA